MNFIKIIVILLTSTFSISAQAAFYNYNIKITKEFIGYDNSILGGTESPIVLNFLLDTDTVVGSFDTAKYHSGPSGDISVGNEFVSADGVDADVQAHNIGFHLVNSKIDSFAENLGNGAPAK